ncbi:MAG TPA: RIP metalloprotease RseP [Gemmatimonadaceae bacterium]|nr:RIP metalloprotease RseP [Gemmatimonadaceae bacterium]
MLTWLAPILVFGLVVLVHELGHFIAARLVGVYAPRFSIGFGRPIWRRRVGETEYVLAWLPLGGYVRMATRDDDTLAAIEGGGEEVDPSSKDWDPNAMKPFGPKPIPADRWFDAKPLWAKLFVLSSGVVMNVVLAIVVLSGLYASYGRPYVPAVVDSVVADRPAFRAGLQSGDSVVAVNGSPITSWSDFVDVITTSPGQALNVTVVRRGTDSVQLSITPELTPDSDPVTGEPTQVGRIGAGPQGRTVRERLSIPQAFGEGWNATWTMTGLVVKVVGGLLTGRVSVNQLGGPIAIAGSSVQAARGGIEQLFRLVAFISVNLAILNLLPIPILDGGQMLLVIAERINGGPFSMRVRERIARVGVFAIALLFILVMFNDVKRLLGFGP